MKSCLYVGHIQHRRHSPARNAFRYRIYMTLLDLDEAPGVFDRFWLWSARRPALAWFRRADFHGPASRPLADAVRDTVEKRTGLRPAGPIRLLTHLRYFGLSFNPVSFYYVYDIADTHVETIVAEITNTPWKERHCYVLHTCDGGGGLAASAWVWQFDKRFHVSPFLPMDMRYHWRLSAPTDSVRVHMENWRDRRKEFDATLTLKRRPLTSGSLALALIAFPVITLQVIALINWQALKLFLKRVPVHPHPDKLPANPSITGKQS